MNAALCAAIGELAVPLFGDEIGLHALQVPMLGMVGDPVRARRMSSSPRSTRSLIPVIAPLAAGPLNVNADEMAAALAVGLEAERILFVTDVPGCSTAASSSP